MQGSHVPANRLDPRVKNAWRVQALAGYVPILLGGLLLAAALWLFVEVPSHLVLLGMAGLLAVLVAMVTLVPAIRYRRWRWEVTEDEIRLQRGLIVIEQTVVPMVRVQHVDTSQGPIIRAFGLSEVRISTAAGRHSIPALADADAAQLRDRIAQLARVSDDGGL